MNRTSFIGVIALSHTEATGAVNIDKLEDKDVLFSNPVNPKDAILMLIDAAGALMRRYANADSAATATPSSRNTLREMSGPAPPADSAATATSDA